MVYSDCAGSRFLVREVSLFCVGDFSELWVRQKAEWRRWDGGTEIGCYIRKRESRKIQFFKVLNSCGFSFLFLNLGQKQPFYFGKMFLF